MDILDTIGNTSLVRLRRVVPAGCAEVFLKLEGENPTGSMKDRMARAVIERAAAAGRLQPGGTVVEPGARSRQVAADRFVVAARRRRTVPPAQWLRQERWRSASWRGCGACEPPEAGYS